MNIDSIIFDLDGTLWNATEVMLDAWNNTLKQNKAIKEEIKLKDFQSVMGLQIKDIGNKFLPDLDEDNQEKVLKECCSVQCDYLLKHGGILYDKLEETLKELSNQYKLFIVSNCENGYIESFFKFHKLEAYFLDFEHPGRTNLTKGENIKLLVERNNLLSPIYVGDTEGDLKAARFAKIPFVYARYGFGEVEGYDYAIDNFNELLELVKSN